MRRASWRLCDEAGDRGDSARRHRHGDPRTGRASAHPLGNFTTNQLVTVSIGEREAKLGVVLDLAEIPTFQLVQRYDRDGDGAISGSESAGVSAELEHELETGLVVRGRRSPGAAAADRRRGPQLPTRTGWALADPARDRLRGTASPRD